MMIALKCYKTLAFSFTAAAFMSSLSGCGFKDNPVPPQEVIPTAITDLRYQLNDKGVTLSWSYPVETITGEDLTEISSFDIYRAVLPVEEYCENCPIAFGRPVGQPGGAVPDEGRKTATYESTLLRPGHMYLFKVRSTSGWWATSEDSNIVAFLWNIPAKAPEGLLTQADDGKVTLNWQPVTHHRDGSALSENVVYQVYRSMGGGAFQTIGEPVGATRFVDTTERNGRKYYYKVQSMSVYEKATVGGGETEVVMAEPLDRTPPAPPVGISVIRTAATVKVFWEPVKEKDLKGYRIYRRLPGEEKMTMIGEINAPYVIFTDQAPPKDSARIFYAVSSIDIRDPANESGRSPEVMTK